MLDTGPDRLDAHLRLSSTAPDPTTSDRPQRLPGGQTARDLLALLEPNRSNDCVGVHGGSSPRTPLRTFESSRALDEDDDQSHASTRPAPTHPKPQPSPLLKAVAPTHLHLAEQDQFNKVMRSPPETAGTSGWVLGRPEPALWAAASSGVGAPVAPARCTRAGSTTVTEGSLRIVRDVDMPRTRYAVASGGVNVAYQVLGHGPTDLVCVPSAGSHLEVFWEEPAVARYHSRLASFSRLILFDKRGVGMSDRIDGVPTVEERMDDVRAVMDAVDSPRAALVGMSEGGAIGAVFAATYPERVSSLVLLGAAIRCWASPDIDLDDPAVIAFLDSNFGVAGPVFMAAPSVAQDDRIRAWAAWVERMGMTPASFRALLRMNLAFDVRSVLSAVTTPTLVIHRTGDLVVGVDQGHEAAELIPGARYVELAGDDHLPYFDDPETTLGLIEEFVTGERHQVEADRVLATVVFTDIVNSTEHHEPDRGPELARGARRLRLDCEQRARAVPGSPREVDRRRDVGNLRRTGAGHPMGTLDSCCDPRPWVQHPSGSTYRRDRALRCRTSRASPW